MFGLIFLLFCNTAVASSHRADVPELGSAEIGVQYNIPKDAKKGSGAEEVNYYWCRSAWIDKTKPETSYKCAIFRPDGYAILEGHYDLQKSPAEKVKPGEACSPADIQRIGFDSGGIRTIYLNNEQKLQASSVSVFVQGFTQLRMEFKDDSLIQLSDVTGKLIK